MYRYIMRFICLWFGLNLIGCTTTKTTSEQLQGAFKTPNGEVYLLGEKQDYKFVLNQNGDDQLLLLEIIRKFPVNNLNIEMTAKRKSYTLQTEFYIPVKANQKKDTAVLLSVNELTDSSSKCTSNTKLERIECSFAFHLQPVRVENREQILKDSAFAKPLVVSVKDTRVDYATTAAMPVLMAGEAVENVVLGAAMVVTAPIWIPVVIFHLKDLNQISGG